MAAVIISIMSEVKHFHQALSIIKCHQQFATMYTGEDFGGRSSNFEYDQRINNSSRSGHTSKIKLVGIEQSSSDIGAVVWFELRKLYSAESRLLLRK